MKRNYIEELVNVENEIVSLMDGVDGLNTNLNQIKNGGLTGDAATKKVNGILSELNEKIISLNSDVLGDEDFLVSLDLRELSKVEDVASRAEALAKQARTVANVDLDVVNNLEVNVTNLTARTKSVVDRKRADASAKQEEIKTHLSKIDELRTQMEEEVEKATEYYFFMGNNGIKGYVNHIINPTMDYPIPVDRYSVQIPQEKFNEFVNNPEFVKIREDASKNDRLKNNYANLYNDSIKKLRQIITEFQKERNAYNALLEEYDNILNGEPVEGYASSFTIPSPKATGKKDVNAEIKAIEEDLLEKFTNATIGINSIEDIVKRGELNLNQLTKELKDLNKGSYFDNALRKARALKDVDEESKEIFERINNICEARTRTLKIVVDINSNKKNRRNNTKDYIARIDEDIRTRFEEIRRDLRSKLKSDLDNKRINKTDFDVYSRIVEDSKLDERFGELPKEYFDENLNNAIKELADYKDTKKKYQELSNILTNGGLTTYLKKYAEENKDVLVGKPLLDELNRGTAERIKVEAQKAEIPEGVYADQLDAAKPEEKPEEKHEEPKVEEKAEEVKSEPVIPEEEKPEEPTPAAEPSKDEEDIVLGEPLDEDTVPNLNTETEEKNEKKVPKKLGKVGKSVWKYAVATGLGVVGAAALFAAIAGGVALAGALPFDMLLGAGIALGGEHLLKGKGKSK